jgi:hypothetical protein
MALENRYHLQFDNILKENIVLMNLQFLKGSAFFYSNNCSSFKDCHKQEWSFHRYLFSSIYLI